MFRLALLLAVTSLLMASCATSQPSVPGESWELGTPEEEILALVNAYRTGHGLRPLSTHQALASVARFHSEAMLTGDSPFSHDGIDRRAALVARHLRFLDFGENLVEIRPSANFTAWRAMSNWLRSDPHRLQIEGCFDLTGIGIARDAERVVVTQLFALGAPTRFARWSNPCP